jgi:hypothetical protein
MFTLDQVVPWGRSFEEYRRMFALTDADLDRTILGCGDGPASFNAEATRRGARVVSCDPIYGFRGAEISARIDATAAQVLEQTRKNAGQFVWDEAIPDVDTLGRIRVSAMQTFLEDFELGKIAGRYVEAALPALPFADRSWDLALCSHFLFLYTSQLGERFHLEAVRELCRVAAEVRIFPLLALGGQRSPFVPACVSALRDAGHAVALEPVPYEFQRGGNQMLRILSPRGRLIV